MFTPEEIQRRKNLLRRDPQTARLCAALGVTVERFLADIEITAADPVLTDDQPPGREAERRASIVATARGVMAKLRRRRDAAAGRHDGVAAGAALEQETTTRRLLGAAD